MNKQKTNLEAVNLVIMYSFNFEYQFVKKIWSGGLQDHLYNKFINLCQRKVNTQAAFMSFYTELDGTNQEKLINYILRNYKG